MKTMDVDLWVRTEVLGELCSQVWSRQWAKLNLPSHIYTNRYFWGISSQQEREEGVSATLKCSWGLFAQVLEVLQLLSSRRWAAAVPVHIGQVRPKFGHHEVMGGRGWWGDIPHRSQHGHPPGGSKSREIMQTTLISALGYCAWQGI